MNMDYLSTIKNGIEDGKYSFDCNEIFTNEFISGIK